MSIQLHPPTLYLATALVDAVAALLMLRALRARRDPFLTCWAAHAALFAPATAAFGLRELLPASLVALTAPPLALLALALLWLGAGRLRRQVRALWLLTLPPMLWLVVAGALAAQGTFRPAIALYAGIALSLLLGAARECWLASREQNLASARDLTLVLLAAALWSLYRMAEPFLWESEPLTPLAGLVTFVFSSAVPFLGLAIARERATAAEVEALRRGRAEVEKLHTNLPAIIFLRHAAPDGTTHLIYRGGDVEAVTGWPADAIARLDSIGSLAEPGTPRHGLFLQALQNGQGSLEWRMRRPDGDCNWMRTSARMLERRPDGSALLVGHVLNIEAERAATEREAAARQMLDQTLAAAPVAVFRGRVMPDGGFSRTYLSRGIERLTGWPWEAINAPGGLQGILEPEKQARVQDNMLDLLRTGEARKTYRVRRADGSWMWARTTLAVLERHPDGGAEVVGYLTDITPEREADAKAVAAAHLAALGEMATGLAHELMQPLLTMSLASENALRALARGDAQAAGPRLQRIVQQAQRAKQLVEHFRRFARGTPADAPPRPVALEAVVEGALVLIGAGLRQAGIAVELALGQPPLQVLGHAVPLEQVLVNLLANARDAMEALPPEATRQVRIAATAAQGMVALTVADTAGGIPREVMDRLFEPFVSTKDPDRGTGLGLSICHGLVTSMGGAIAARNEGPGAIFTITLPAAPVAPPPSRPEHTAEPLTA